MPSLAPLRRTLFCCSLGLLAVVFALATPQTRGDDSEQLEHFENHIRPLFLERCSECHGDAQQENGLRLDSRGALIQGGQRGTAVVPGNAEASLLYRVVSGKEEDLTMPPEGKPLSAEEQEYVARWIRQGAHWSETQPSASITPLDRMAEIRRTHWAYQPIAAPALPKHAPSQWPRNTIDHFVLARLEAAGLHPAAEADRRTLIRRAYFDLIGLPPSYEEVEAFVADERENAYELLIERLLEQPEYGQRWGRHWLDVARYSDTRGHTNVPGTEIRYPFAWTYRDYVIRALNEDRPYDRFLNEQLAADLLTETAEENLAALGFLTVGRRFLNRHHRILGERIDLVSRGLMGITIMCAKCHDHKFDPFSMRDFYALYGIFASSAEPLAIDLPEIGPAHGTDRRRAELLKAGLEEELEPLLEEWAELRDALIEEDLQQQADAYLALAAATALGKDLAEVDLDDEDGTSDRGIKAWRELLEEQAVLARFWQPLLGLAEEDLTEEAFVDRAADLIAKDQESNRLIREALLREKPDSLIEAVRVIGQTISGVYERWEKLQELDPGDDGFADPAAEEIRTLLALALEAGVPASDAEQARWFLGRACDPLMEKSRELETIFLKYRDLVPVRAMALIDAQLPRDAAVQIRGNPEKPGPIVRRQFYELLAADCEAEPITEGSGRQQLAQWITHPKNPLTARVIANRIWGWHFDQHLVATPSDFGTRAVPPTHPALLDHLAVSLRDSGWSLKALHRLIMQSASYRQQSLTRPEAAAKDPENHFYWRMNRRRLEFEPMRDAMLTATGELDRRLGGPPLDDLDSPRRSVYLLHDRRSMAPVLPTFDVPAADATLPKRSETTVPQQALYLMNSGFVTRRATRLAARLAKVLPAAEPAESLVQLYRWVYGRDPSADEQAEMEDFLIQTALAFLSRPEAETQLTEHDACWSLGSGRFDEQRELVADFEPLPHFDGRRWWQSKACSWQDVYLDALGGRPGAERAAVCRWRAPAEVGKRYVLRGTFRGGRHFGDGVDVQVVSSREGLLEEFEIDELEAVEIHLENLQIEAGDTIDLVVSPREENAFDDFSWSPRIVEVGQTESGQPYPLRQWRFEHAFRRSVPVWEGGLDPWEQLAQVLLISNEFMFVD